MNPYSINLDESNIQGPLASLEVLYEGMPGTSGCSGCVEVNGDNAEWCCLTQNPSMYYVEFLHVLKFIQDGWSYEDRKELLFRAVRNYLDNSLSKGCIFYMGSGCSIHSHRPFGCRMYGVIPQESWDKRWEALRDRQGDQFEALSQCTLVTADKEISVTQEDKWFEHTKKCEERIGLMPARIKLHDEAGGSYRTFHDHLLLEMLGDGVMTVLSNARMTNPSDEDIEATIEQMRGLVNEETLRSQMS